jgi:splicing factor 1
MGGAFTAFCVCHVKTQTKIMIRGKGATKEGKLGRAGLPQPGEDEPLHALITGNTPELVKNSVDKVRIFF